MGVPFAHGLPWVAKENGVTPAWRCVLRGLQSYADWSLRAMQQRDSSNVLAATEGRIEGPGGAAARLGLKPSTLRTRIQMLKTTR